MVAVYTAADLGDYWKPAPLLVPPPPIPGLVFNECTQVPLAQDKVRYVGEPLAMVVAESRYVAEDALGDIVVEIEPLDAVVDLEAALAPECAADPRASDVEPGRARGPAQGRLRRAHGAADVVITRRFLYDRGVAAAIENRAVAATWNAAAKS